MSCKIKDLCERIGSGGTPSRKNKSYYNLGNIKWLKTKELDDIKIYDTEEKITEEGLKKSSAKLYPKDTIVMAMYGATVGKLGIIKEEMCTNQACCNMVVDSNKCNYKFLYYSLLYNRESIINLANGAAQQNLSVGVIGDYEINLPSLEEQEKIADILSSLDDKVELNNEMNKTLEEMAQSIFKRWFVDFEFPNEDGEPYKSSGGEMVDSELGMIPKGWEVQCIGDIGNVITGKTPSAKVEGSYGDECNFITPRDITDSPIILNTERKLSSIGINNLKKNLVCKNSIGVSCIGSNLGEVYITGENSITNQQINTVVLDESHIYPYVYIYLKNMKNEFLNMAGGSAVPIINKTSFSGINILMPDMYILNKFVQSTTCYFERIEENLKENESLIALRDNLLPKLMSGEIDLSK